MISNLIIGLVMAFNESKMFRFICCLIILALILVTGAHQYNKAIENAYNRGWNAAYAKVAEDEQTQSMKLQDTLQTIFDKHTQTVQQSLQKDKEQRDEIAKILQNSVYHGDCHSIDGIGLLNKHIENRTQ